MALVVVVRYAQPSEVDAAVDVWRVANGADVLPGHPERLTRWAQEPGAVLFVADDTDRGLIGMALSLSGRVEIHLETSLLDLSTPR